MTSSIIFQVNFKPAGYYDSSLFFKSHIANAKIHLSHLGIFLLPITQWGEIMSEGALHFHAYIRFKIITLYERYRISFSLKRKYKKQKISFGNDSNTLWSFMKCITTTGWFIFASSSMRKRKMKHMCVTHYPLFWVLV